MKRFLLLIVIFLSALIYADNVFSQSSVTDETKKKLQEIEQRAATTNPVATSSASKAGSTITFASGNITNLQSPNLLMTTIEGTKSIYTTDNTKFYNIDSLVSKLIGFGDLKLGDNVFVIGLAPTTNSGTAKVVVRDNSPFVKTFSLLGKVRDLTATSLLLNNYNNPNLTPNTLTLNADTLLLDSKGSKLITSEILTGDKVVVVGTIDDKGTLLAKEIYKFDAAAKNKTATSSTISAH